MMLYCQVKKNVADEWRPKQKEMECFSAKRRGETRKEEQRRKEKGRKGKNGRFVGRRK